MYTSSYSSYGAGLGSSLSSRPSLPSLPSLPSSPPYSSPYSGVSRFRDYSVPSSDFSIYPTPLNYSTYRLTRGSSLPEVSSPLCSPITSRTLTRQTSLEKERAGLYLPRRTTGVPAGQYELLYQDQVRGRGSLPRRVKEEKKRRPISCNKVYHGIIIGNGETVCDISYLKSHGVTHVLNTAEEHVMVDQSKYAQHGIKYYGFHVDDLPHCDIARYFSRTTDFINSAVTGGGLVVVNCYMGLSRSASCVLAYLITKQGMSLNKALDFVKKSRAVRPNEGFLNQLRDLERSVSRRR